MQNEELIHSVNKLIVEEIQSRLSGMHNDYVLYSGDWPSDIFPAGNLVNSPKGSAQNTMLTPHSENGEDTPEYMRSNYTPSSMGLSLNVENFSKESKINLDGYFYIFYTIFPSRTELLNEFQRRYGNNSADRNKILFPKKFARYKIEFKSNVKIEELIRESFYCIPSENIQIESDSSADLEIIRDESELPKEIELKDCKTEESYEGFKKKLNKGQVPVWDFELLFRLRKINGLSKIDIFLVNRSLSPSISGKNLWNRDPFIFAPKLTVHLLGLQLGKMKLYEVEGEDYRYSTHSSASGRNCHVVLDRHEMVAETEIFPVLEQNAISTNPNTTIPTKSMEFHELSINDPRPKLEVILEAMKSYLLHWEKQARDFEGKTIQKTNETAWEQMIANKELFSNEIENFESGLKSLENSELRKAFQLMNRSFHKRFVNTSEASSPKWRLFQLVFVVSTLPSILSREEPEFSSEVNKNKATVLSFPTGSGKTEAFTGVVVTQAFYDRIRGKNTGVSAWMKFPLRFLSMQQMERALLSIEAANIILREYEDEIIDFRKKRGLDGTFEEFTIGFLVGGTTTPNDPTRRDGFGKSALDHIRRGDAESKKYMIISKCPHCLIENGNKGMIYVEGDTKRSKIVFKCRKCGHRSPILISDTEIYSELPTLLVSTIDKGAVFGFKPDAKTLMGITLSKCPIHGYSSLRKCWKKDCKESVEKVEPIYDGPPSILIQDELHMLNESLGSFSGLYETFLQNLAIRSNEYSNNYRGPWKVITSTATIAGVEDHIRSLYLRDFVLFPAKGPSSDESFYFSENHNKPQRLIVGFSPHNMTHPNAVVKTLQYFHAFIKKIEGDYDLLRKFLNKKSGDISDIDIKNALKFVRTSLMYGIVKSETYQILQSINDQINPYLESVGLNGIQETRDVTGDTSMADNVKLMDELTSDENADFPEFIVATSAISHGVDISKLNFMVFRGQPRNTAEFIQSMSRVGRKYEGIVVVVYNPNRERDSSHYMLHDELLSIGNVLISPPSVDRYSMNAMEKCSGGIILGNALFGKSNKALLYSSNFIKYIRENNERDILYRSFMDSYFPNFGNIEHLPNAVVDYLDNLFSNKIKELSNIYSKEPVINQYTSVLLGCMNSLRQTDTEIDLSIDDDGLLEAIRNARSSEVKT